LGVRVKARTAGLGTGGDGCDRDGREPQEALREIGQAVEGYLAARAVHAVAAREGVEMPICAGIYRTLYEGLPAREVVHALMTRPIRAEID
jgi:glycerol-3-phosphate dehydrogenase (NAD(P)+)